PVQQIGRGSPETEAARTVVARGPIRVDRDEATPAGTRLLTGKVQERPVELLLDGDGRMVRGKCTCSHHFKGGLRKGPCRHLQALRSKALGSQFQASVQQWFEHLWN